MTHSKSLQYLYVHITYRYKIAIVSIYFFSYFLRMMISVDVSYAYSFTLYSYMVNTEVVTCLSTERGLVGVWRGEWGFRESSSRSGFQMIRLARFGAGKITNTQRSTLCSHCIYMFNASIDLDM